MPESLRVLIADDDPQALRLTRRVLERRGMTCIEATNGHEAALLARRERPDVVLLDVHMPVSGTEGLRLLRADHRTALTPVIILTGDPRLESVVAHLLQGADDYVTKPWTAEELEARILVATRRRAVLGSVSPLTGMPGNVVLTAEIDRRLAAGQPFALLHVDLDDFKPYNDRYGYVHGDRVISVVADVLREVAGRRGDADVLLAHIGGDDFAVVAPPEVAGAFAQEVVDGFAARRDALHDPQDVAAGHYAATDRRGTERHVGLLALSVGIAVSTARPFGTAAELADVAAELKTVAKRTPGPAVAADRRTAAA